MFVMIKLSITIFVFTFICKSITAQSSFASNANTLYTFNDNLDRITVQENEEECTLSISTVDNKILLLCGSSKANFTLLGVHEVTMESGSIFNYDLLGEDGSKLKLEVNTQKNIFTFKPWEIKSGEVTRKYYTAKD